MATKGHFVSPDENFLYSEVCTILGDTTTEWAKTKTDHRDFAGMVFS